MPSSAAEELADLLRQIRDNKTDGIAALRALAERFPDSPELLGQLAYALARREEHEESLAVLRRKLALLPENPEARWRIGDRLVALGRLDEALEAYEAVLRDHPDCADARMGAGYVRYLRRTGGEGRDTQGFAQKEPGEAPRENRALNRREFEEQRLRLQSLPPKLYLESTTKCNFYCRTCIKGYGPYYAEDLHPDVLEKVRRELLPASLGIFISGYGEPMLAANFDEIFRRAVESGARVSFITNGSLLNFRRIEWLSRAPVDVAISIDGATKETFEAIRRGSNFEQICDRLAMIKKLRDIHPSRPFGCSFIFVALQKNIHELPDVVRLAQRYDVTRVAVADYAFIHTDLDEQSPRFDPERTNRFLGEAREVAAQLGVELLLPPLYALEAPPAPRQPPWDKIRRASRLLPERNRFPQRCPSPWQEPYIRTDGKVRPCCANNSVLGDLRKSSFAAIWNGWRYRRLRRRIHGALPPLDCRRCVVHWGINGGNPGNVMAREGVLVKAYYFGAVRLKRFAAKAGGAFRKLTGRGGRAEPEPNFDQGRPLASRD